MRIEMTWVLGFILGLSLLTSALGQVSPGEGQVLNTSTERPIEGAKVILVCSKQHFRLADGNTSVLRTVTVISGKDGAYAFSLFDVLGCSYTDVYAEKDGFVSSGQVAIRYQSHWHAIPKVSYLTPEADVVMLRLRLLGSYKTGNVYFQDGRYAAGADYKGLYASFLEAKFIAQTGQEKDFVRAAFCQRLLDLHGSLSDDDKKDIRQYAVTVGFRGKYVDGKYDHDAEVVPFCSTSKNELRKH